MTHIPLIRSIDDIRAILANLPGPDTSAAAAAQAREPQLTKPPGSLGRLEDLSLWLATWQGRHPPRMDHPAARVFAGNHGVVAHGISAYPAAVTEQMVANFRAGGAAVNQLCRTFDVALDVHALDLDKPTQDFTTAPAMTEDEFIEAFRVGMTSVSDGFDVLCLGEMGIGNTTAAAALACALLQGSARDWVGPGTGLDGDGIERKTDIVAKAVQLHGTLTDDPLELARRLGGRELAAIAGAVLAARLKKIPVILDGYICTAAALPLERGSAGALDHCQIAHVSAEPGHRRLLTHLGKAPLLDLGLRLGEASGAVLAVAVLRAAVACHTGMATFVEAGVSDKSDD